MCCICLALKSITFNLAATSPPPSVSATAFLLRLLQIFAYCCCSFSCKIHKYKYICMYVYVYIYRDLFICGTLCTNYVYILWRLRIDRSVNRTEARQDTNASRSVLSITTISIAITIYCKQLTKRDQKHFGTNCPKSSEQRNEKETRMNNEN